MRFFKSLLLVFLISIFSFNAKAVTLNAIMENVPDTLFIQELLPDFKAKTGIDVEFEINPKVPSEADLKLFNSQICFKK